MRWKIIRKKADWNQQQLTDGSILANRNSINHPYCFLSNQKKSPDSGFFACYIVSVKGLYHALLPKTSLRTCSWQDSFAWGTEAKAELPHEARKPWGIFASSKAVRENPACHISFLWVLNAPTFVTLFGTIWLPSHEELCNTKLTCKRARPNVIVKSQTKQLFIESYSGSRQGMMQ